MTDAQNPSGRDSSQSTVILRYAVVAALAWTVLVVLSSYWNLRNLEDQAVFLATAEARSNWNKDQSFHRWASKHGGLYVRPDARTPPSPYLAHIPDRDVETTDGVKLTLMDLASMMRQMTQEFEELYGTKGKLTGRVLLNPLNKADPWELAALAKFEAGAEEVVEQAEINGQAFIRLMRPMVMKKSCLKCHAHLGFKEGEIRGGVSVSVPLAKYWMIGEKSKTAVLTTHGGVWSFGLLVIGFVGLWGHGRETERGRDKQDLQESKEKYRALVESQSELICRFQPDTTLTFVNAAFARFFGENADDLIGGPFVDLLPDDERDRTPAHYASFTARRAVRENERESVDARGRTHWHLWSSQAFFGDDGTLRSFQATGTDITKRKRAEADVQRMAVEEAALGELLKLALRNIPMEDYLQASASRDC